MAGIGKALLGGALAAVGVKQQNNPFLGYPVYQPRNVPTRIGVDPQAGVSGANIKSPTLLAAAEIRAQLAAATLFTVVDSQGNKNETSPLARFLANNNQSQLIHDLSYDYYVQGAAYLLLDGVRSRMDSRSIESGGEVEFQNLTRISPNDVQPEYDGGMSPRILTGYNIYGKHYDPNAVIAWVSFSGMGAISRLQRALAIEELMLRYKNNAWAAVAKPALLYMDGALDGASPEDYDDLYQDIKAKLANADNATSLGVFVMGASGSLTVMPSPADNDFSAMYEFIRSKVAADSGVMPPLLGSNAPATYSNVGEFRKHLLLDTLIPEMSIMASLLSARLLPDGLRIAIDITDITALQSEHLAKAQTERELALAFMHRSQAAAANVDKQIWTADQAAQWLARYTDGDS